MNSDTRLRAAAAQATSRSEAERERAARRPNASKKARDAAAAAAAAAVADDYADAAEAVVHRVTNFSITVIFNEDAHVKRCTLTRKLATPTPLSSYLILFSYPHSCLVIWMARFLSWPKAQMM